MSRYRLLPSPTQEQTLREHCAHARYVWNLAVEQQSWWHPGRGPAPGWAEQCRQLSGARAEHDWLAMGSVIVQQQALRDFSQAMSNYFNRTHRKPTWHRAGWHEGFRIVGVRPGYVRRLNRKTGTIYVPKVGWVRFRWSRPVPQGVKILPGEDGPLGSLACRLRSYTRAHPRAGNRQGSGRGSWRGC